MVVDHLKGATIKPFSANEPISTTVVSAAPIMSEHDRHLNLKPVELPNPRTPPRMISPVEPFDHGPLNA